MDLSVRRIFFKDQRAHLVRAGRPLLRTGPIKGKGRGQRWCWISQPENVTAMVALAKAVPNLPSLWKRSFALYLCFCGRFIPVSSRECHSLEIWESTENFERVSPRKNTAAPLNFQQQQQQQQQREDREEESTGPRYYHPLVIDRLSTFDSTRSSLNKMHSGYRVNCSFFAGRVLNASCKVTVIIQCDSCVCTVFFVLFFL